MTPSEERRMHWDDVSATTQRNGTEDVTKTHAKWQNNIQCRGPPGASQTQHNSSALTDSKPDLLQSDDAIGVSNLMPLVDDRHTQLISSRDHPSNESGYYSSPWSQEAHLSSVFEILQIDSETDDLSSESDKKCDKSLKEHCFHSDDTEREAYRNSFEEIYEQDEDGDTKLHLALIHEMPDIAQEFIALAPNSDWLDIPNTMLQTALHLAVITNLLGVVRYLMSAGASLACQDYKGFTPLHVACSLKNKDAVRTLLEPLTSEECEMNPHVTFRKIPQDLKIRNYVGETCLHIAAMTSSVDIMDLLLRFGSDINAQDGRSGRTVLHYVAEAGDVVCVNFLLRQRGLNINSKTFGDYTPIQLAFGRNFHEVFRILYEHGAKWENIDD